MHNLIRHVVRAYGIVTIGIPFVRQVPFQSLRGAAHSADHTPSLITVLRALVGLTIPELRADCGLRLPAAKGPTHNVCAGASRRLLRPTAVS